MTTTPQAALLSDELHALIRSFGYTTNSQTHDLVTAILAKLQATQKPVQAGELPDERKAFKQWWRQRQLLTFPKDYDQSRLADWGAAYKPAAKDAWQARAALSARKPSVDEHQYRLLSSGVDEIEASDEFLSEDTKTWAIDPNGIFVGMVYGGRVLRPARRRINGIGLEVKL